MKSNSETLIQSNTDTDNISCSTLKKLLNSYIDKELDEITHLFVTRHLEKCENCSKYYNQLKLVVDAAIALRRESIPDDVALRLEDCLNKLKN
ncbi:MAG: zf-HC2 domain-containing protein [Deltaproteobacteria bacterium]|nr:zf-HC2 domain-containing protein [Deltaproteobacteria bacterium]